MTVNPNDFAGPGAFSNMISASGDSVGIAVSRLLSVVAVLWASVVAASFLTPDPFADVFFAAWVLVAAGLAIAGGVAIWTFRTALSWVSGLSLGALSVLGMWSIGPYIAPAAGCLLVAALLVQVFGPRPPERARIQVDRRTVRAAGRQALVGTAAVILGGWLVFEGVFVRELFAAACASETLACALAVTRWDSVGLAALGLAAVGYGSWLVWNQVPVGRALAAGHLG